jgi:serpin B
MRSHWRISLFVAGLLPMVFCGMSLGDSPLSAPPPGPVDGNTRFAIDLYGRLAGQPGNLFFSPYSISTALAMTYAGARGATEQQMAAVLRFTATQDQLHAGFKQLQTALNDIQQQGNIALHIANALWVQQGRPFARAFLDLAGENYRAKLAQADFRTAAESTRGEINAWVEDQTNRKITELVPPGAVDALTRLVLVNAIYFKGNWAQPFEKRDTQDAPFWIESGRQVSVPLMRQERKFNYWEDEQLQVLELPYAGKDLSMVVLLPKARDGLAAVEKSLSPASLDAWIRGLHTQKLQVYLPRFTTSSQFSLGNTLVAMGMADAFEAGRADFSGMDGSRELSLTAVIHKAFVDVNEEGTEAAAATGVMVGLAAMPAPPQVFRADHPFLFLIRDNHSGSILFLGRLADPARAS